MLRIQVFTLYILVFCSFDLYAQHQSLLDIINEDYPREQIQQKIDSLTSSSEQQLPLNELSEYYHDVGVKWYFRNWRKEKSINSLKKAIKYTEKALEVKRTADNLEACSINKTLFNLGFFKRLNESIFEAIKIFQELDIYGTELCSEQLNDRDKVKWARYELGELYIITGDYYKAIDVYNRIISRYENGDITDDNRRYGAIEAYIQLAEIYFKLNLQVHHELIQNFLNKAEALILENDPDFNHNLARIDNLKGNCFLILQDYYEASEFYPSVIERLPHNDSINRAEVYSNLGYVFNNLKTFDKAEIVLKRALNYNPKNGNVHNNLGDLYLGKDDFNTALEEYNTAIILEIGKPMDLKYDQLPTLELLQFSVNKVKLLNHIVTKANAWISYYEYDKNLDHLQDALDTFTLADQLVDLIRFVSNERASKLYWREKSSALYMKAVEVCYLLDKPEEAFHFMERNKALLLLEDLSHEEAKNIAQIPDALGQREFKLKRRIFLDENELFETEHKNKEHTDSLKALVNESKYKYQEFIDSLNTAFPEYAKFKKKTTILPFEELRSGYLGKKQVVLHYILNEEDGYGLLTTENTSDLFQLNDTEKLNEDIESLTKLLSNGVSNINTFNTLSNAVFKNLIPEPISRKIKGKQLIIIPDYTLQRLPFETLVTDTEKQKYLLEEAEISYVYSMSLLDHNRGFLKNTAGQLLGVAPVKFASLGLPSLNNSQSELTGIADFFEGQVLLNESATKANFMKAAESPKIIHLATHADLGNGENPWIAFRDEKMYLKEIYAIKTTSEMVVLSACNTSSGNLKRGEGVMSLARGFFYGGAKSVVSSLWPVPDESGKKLMTTFYKNLDKGYSKSRALRQAKLDYLSSVKAAELKHPFYWAGFIVVGDNSPLVTSMNWPLINIGLILILILIYFFRKKLFKRFK